MKRVDCRRHASQRESGRDATVAESRHNIGLGCAGQTSLRQPSRQLGEEGFIHARIIQPKSLSWHATELKRDDFSSNRHRALTSCWSMIFSENRYPPRIKCGAGFFGIML